MAIQKHARNLLFYDVVVSRRAKQAPYPPLAELVELWIEASDASFPAKTFEKGMVTSIIKKVQVDADTESVTLLLEVSDKNASNVTYLDHSVRSSRHIPKEEPEGNGHGAHVVISLRQETGKPNVYLAIIEQMPTIGAHRIQSTLNSAISELCKAAGKDGRFTYVKPGGGAKAEPYVPHIVLGGHPSDQFIQDVETGRINGLQLFKPVEKVQLGENPYLHIEQISAKISVSKDIPEGQRWTTLIAGAKMKKDEFPQARIYVTPEADGPSFHIDFDSDTGTVMSEGYIKSRRIGGFDPLLETSSPDGIVGHFEARVKDILIKDRT